MLFIYDIKRLKDKEKEEEEKTKKKQKKKSKNLKNKKKNIHHTKLTEQQERMKGP